MLLERHLQTAIDAHNGTSFSPRKRGENLIQECSVELENDLKEILDAGANASDLAQYKVNYEKHLTDWLHAKSRCVSTMIAGPSNFPTSRAEKANNSEHKRYTELQSWRDRAKKAIKKSFEPEKTFESEIDRLTKELESRKKSQELMKLINKIVRKAKGKDCTAELIAAGVSERLAAESQKPDFMGKAGCPAYMLQNNLSNIKRIEGRIRELESKVDMAENVQTESVPFDGGEVIFNFELDRLQLIYDGKPDHETRSKLKRSGFRWAPSQGAWQRQLTRNAIWKAEQLLGIPLNQIETA